MHLYHLCLHWRLWALYGMIPSASSYFCAVLVPDGIKGAWVLGWSLLTGGSETILCDEDMSYSKTVLTKEIVGIYDRSDTAG